VTTKHLIEWKATVHGLHAITVFVEAALIVFWSV